MTTLATTITPTAQTTFSSIPNGVTQASGDESLRLATTAYVQANTALLTPSSYLLTNTNQTLTGNTGLSFTATQIVTDVDSIASGDTLVLGETGDGNISLGQSTSASQLYIKSYLQPITSIWKYWANGCVNTTPAGTGVSSTSVAVLCKKMLSGSFVISSLSTTISFSPAFTNKPVVILCVRSTSTTSGTLTNINRYVTGVSPDGFTAVTTATNTNTIMNWFAIGD